MRLHPSLLENKKAGMNTICQHHQLIAGLLAMSGMGLLSHGLRLAHLACKSR